MQGMVIDGAVPRTAYERCEMLFEYLVRISQVGPHSDLDPAKHEAVAEDYDYWTSIEDEILTKINEQLPEGYVCTVGLPDPGDVRTHHVDEPE